MPVKLGAGGSPGRQVDRFLSEIERKCETKENWSPVSSCFCSFRVNKSTPHRKPPRTGRSGRRQLTCGHRPASRSPCPLSTRNLTDSPVLQKQSATSFHSMNDLCFHFVIFHKRINLSMKFRWKYANEVRYHLSAAIH